MLSLRVYRTLCLLELLRHSFADREREDTEGDAVFNANGVEVHEHSSFNLSASSVIEKSGDSLSLRYCCFTMGGKAENFNDIAGLGTISVLISTETYKLEACKITSLPSQCMASGDSGDCPAECKKEIHESKHYWYLVWLQRNKEVQEAEAVRNTQNDAAESKRKQTEADALRNHNKREETARKKKEARISELNKQITRETKKESSAKEVYESLKKQLEELQKKLASAKSVMEEQHTTCVKLQRDLKNEENTTRPESATFAYLAEKRAAGEEYREETKAASDLKAKTSAEAQEMVDAARALRKEAQDTYNGNTTTVPQKVPKGCEKEGGWEGNSNLPGAETCCCSLCQHKATCYGVKTISNFIDWDDCFTRYSGDPSAFVSNAQLEHVKYVPHVSNFFGACDALSQKCPQCETSACSADDGVWCPGKAESR